MKRLLIRLVLCCGVLAIGWFCLAGPIQKWPYFRGRSLHWDWALDLRSEDAEARKRAAEALGQALTDGNTIVRRAAVHALVLGWEHPDETKIAVPALVKAVNDEDEDVRITACNLLKRLDPEAARQAGIRDN
jgi:HEAT repeat protein